MRIIRGLTNLPKFPYGCILAIGNFDSVHLGHQRIIKQLIHESTARSLPSVVMVFEPQPVEFFRGYKASVRLSSFRAKAEMFRALGVDFIFVVHFTKKFANLTPDQFIEKYLIKGLQAKYITVGDDFHFGRNRSGNFDSLEKVSRQYGFIVEKTPALLLSDCGGGACHARRISSTWVRESLAVNDFKIVEQLLGHPYTLCGHVAHGDGRGHQLGFPTANIHLKHHLSPVLGIYVVQVRGLDDKLLPGVASVGHRPTFGGDKVVLEVYLLDFNRDIYGKRICVEFLHQLRDEIKFDTVDSLLLQMKQDVIDTRFFLKRINDGL